MAFIKVCLDSGTTFVYITGSLELGHYCDTFRSVMESTVHLPVQKDVTSIDFFFSMPPHVLYGLRGLPSWAWQKCNRLLRWTPMRRSYVVPMM